MSSNKPLIYHKYVYKDVIYNVMGRVRLKHPVTGEWVDAVLYDRRPIDNTPMFVREEKDFLAKFIPLEN